MVKLLISSLVAVMIIALGFLGLKKIGTKETKEAVSISKVIPSVFVEEVKNAIKPITLKSNGALVAKNKIDLFSEVQGVFEESSHLFKPGVAYRKGDVLLRMNSDEFRANLLIQKSNLYQKLISILPDLKLDYPSQLDKWESYISDFDINRSIQSLPSFDNQQEKQFITGRGIPTAFYTVNNLQKRLAKYTIYAPYYGILSKTNVDKGTLINPGQRIGTFISPSIYELEVSMSTSVAEFIKLGKTVAVETLDEKSQWTGKITRINPIVDAQTQSMTFYVQVSGKGLKEGMYLAATLATANSASVFEIDRSLLFNNNYVHIVERDSILRQKEVNVIHLGSKTALIKGLDDGVLILSQPLPGAFDGKIVKLKS